MDQAALSDDVVPGRLKDELAGNFDPSQETYEEYLQRINLERPFNMNQGGIIGKPGGVVERGVMYYGKSVKQPKTFVSVEGLANYLPFSKENLEDVFSKLDRPSEIRNALTSSGIKLIKHQKKPGGRKYNVFKIPTETQIDNFWENYTKIINKKTRTTPFRVPAGIMEPFKNEVNKVYSELIKQGDPFTTSDIYNRVSQNLAGQKRVYIPSKRGLNRTKVPTDTVKRLLGDDKVKNLIDGNILKNQTLTANRLKIANTIADGPIAVDKLSKLLKINKNDLHAQVKLLFDDVYNFISAQVPGSSQEGKGLKAGYLKDYKIDDLKNLLNNLRKSGFKYLDERSTRRLLFNAYGDSKSPTYSLSKYNRVKRRFNAYVDINNQLREMFGVNFQLDHPLSFKALKDIKNIKPEQLIKVTPIPAEINNLKSQFDNKYKNVISDLRKVGPNKELLQQKKMIEQLSTNLGLGKFKISAAGNKVLDFGGKTLLEQDIGKKMIENVDLQNKVVDNVKKLDKNKELTDKLIEVFGKESRVPDSVINLKKTGNMNKIIRVLKSLIKKKPDLRAAADDLLNTISEGIIPSVAAAEVEAAEVEAAETAPLKIDTSIAGELIPPEAISTATLPIMKYGKKIMSGLGKTFAGIDLPPVQAALAVMDPTSLAYTLPFSNMAAEHTGMYKKPKTKLEKLTKGALRGMPRKVAQNVLPMVSRASIPFSVAYGVGEVAKAAKPDYYIDPNTQEPTFYKRDHASNVFPGMIDVYDQAMKISKEKGISYNDALEYVDWEGTADKWLGTSKTIEPFAGGGIASIRRPKAIPPKAGPMPDASGLSTLYNRVKRI
jgi:hypothetical protein